MQLFNKKHELADLLRIINGWKLKNDRIVFTNGCFDIIHPGHVSYLAEAKALGHKLIVGINTDRSVKMLDKSPDRPFNSEEARMSVLAALHSVDAVIFFDDETPLELVCSLKPDILVKGGDYDPNQVDVKAKDYIVGSKEVREWGGQVIQLGFLPGFSTTNLVEKIKKSV